VYEHHERLTPSKLKTVQGVVTNLHLDPSSITTRTAIRSRINQLRRGPVDMGMTEVQELCTGTSGHQAQTISTC